LLDAKPQIISKDSIRTMFHKVREILQCHKMFQIELTEVARVWDSEEKIGDVFTASVKKIKEIYFGKKIKENYIYIYIIIGKPTFVSISRFLSSSVFSVALCTLICCSVKINYFITLQYMMFLFCYDSLPALYLYKGWRL